MLYGVFRVNIVEDCVFHGCIIFQKNMGQRLDFAKFPGFIVIVRERERSRESGPSAAAGI